MPKLLYSLKNVKKLRKRDSGYTLLIPNLRIRQGDMVALTGSSGCGKSTTLDLLGMALRPDDTPDSSFTFSTGGTSYNVNELWQQDNQVALSTLRREHVSYILQTGGLLPFLTVEENMTLAAEARTLPAPFDLTKAQPDDSHRSLHEMAQQVAEKLGIAHLLKANPSTLSIGERQRVAMGRALIGKPRVILADEPTAALDPMQARAALRLLVESVDRTATALVLVTHDHALLDCANFLRLHTRLVAANNSTLAVVEAQ